MPSKSIFISILLVVLLAGLNCSDLKVERLYENGMVATGSPLASKIGINILKEGGNAADAAVAIGFVMAVCYPEAGNIGGGGFALYYSSSDRNIRALDFRETAPLGAFRDMYLDQDKNVVPESSTLGAKASGIPGTVAGLYQLWKDYGSMPWYDLVSPSIRLADGGFIIDEYLADELLEYSKSLQVYPETKKYLYNEGNGYKAGDRLIQSDLARTLERIAHDSTDGFYSGETAIMIAACMQKYGGLITVDDLAAYRPVWRDPIHIKFDSLDIYSMPPPSSGGVIVGQILKLLEPYEFGTYSAGSEEYIHLFAEACRLAFADRAEHLGDPEYHDNPISELLDPAYIESRRSLIDPNLAGISEDVTSGLPGRGVTTESESTTHFCVADKDGNIVSLTYTLNASFGSKLMVDGAGFMLNNEMDDFSIKPGQPNLYGLIGGEANEIAPGKRMLSSMSPTILLKNGKPNAALGAPGGSKIITTVAEAIIDYGRFGMSPLEIVAQPRFHHQWLPDTLYLEQGGFDINTMQGLISRGHFIKERPKYSDLQLIIIDEDGYYRGASDPRKNGSTIGY